MNRYRSNGSSVHEKYKIIMSLGCYVPATRTSFSIPLTDKIIIKNTEISKDELTIDFLKKYIWEQEYNNLKELVDNASKLDLWRVNVDDADDVYTEEDIVQKLSGEKMKPLRQFNYYFNHSPEVGKTHIIIQPPVTIATTQKRSAGPESFVPRKKRLPSVVNLDEFEKLVAEIEEKITIDPPPEIYPESSSKIAGRFSKKGSLIPISGKGFPDMRLGQFVTPAGKDLIKKFEGDKKFQLMYGVSGIGKTRAIFDMTIDSELFVTYIECRLSSDQEAKHYMEPTADRSYATLFESITIAFNELPINFAIGKAKRLIALEFVARVLYFILLIRKMEKLTPRDYLLAQINGGQATIGLIKTHLGNFEYDIEQMESIFTVALESYLKGRKLIFAIDEANIAATQHFHGKFKNVHDKPRGLLTPMVEFLEKNQASIIIAGTSFSLEQGKGIISDIGKGVTPDYLEKFQTFTIEEVESYLEKYIEFSECNLKEIKDFQFLVGRPRFSSRLLLEIIRLEAGYGKEKSKQNVLEEAIQATIIAVSERLKLALENFTKEAYEYDDIDQYGWKDTMEMLFVNCWFFGGYVPKCEVDDRSRRLIDSGIARLVKNDKNKFMTIDEPLAVEAVKTVLLSKYTKPDQALLGKLSAELKRNAANVSDTSKGATWQYLAQAGLMNFNEKSVADFVKDIYGDKVFEIGGIKQTKLPVWSSEAIINIKSYGDLGKLSWQARDQSVPKNEVDFISMLLEIRKNRVYMLEPSSKMRPDGVYIGNEISANVYWTLLFSAKIYKQPLSGKGVGIDKRTTDWNYVYYENSESEETHQISNHAIRKEFDRVCKGYRHQGSLRIHFILPGVAESKDKSEDRGGCRVEGNDIIMYIDKNMLHKYFKDPQYIKLIEDIYEMN